MIAKQLFGKQLSDIDLHDLESFFLSPKVESDKVEFKSFVHNKEASKADPKMSKNEHLRKIKETICAFLNTDGGLLIWGAPQGISVAGAEKTFQGALAPVSLDFGKDQIINVIIAAINPTPNRILFHSVSVKDSGNVYLFEVAASDFAPHQTSGTYYMRLDGQTKFAPHQSFVSQYP